MGKQEIYNLLVDGKERTAKEIAEHLQQRVAVINPRLNELLKHKEVSVKISKINTGGKAHSIYKKEIRVWFIKKRQK